MACVRAKIKEGNEMENGGKVSSCQENLWVVWVKVAQSCPTLCEPLDSSLPGSSVHRILQARILEWIAISFSRGSSRSRNWTQVPCIVGRFFTIWATREAQSFWGEILNRVFFFFFFLSKACDGDSWVISWKYTFPQGKISSSRWQYSKKDSDPFPAGSFPGP